MKRKREIELRFTAAQPVELRAGEGDRPPELHGYAAVFDQWTTISDLWGLGWLESVAPGAYAKTIGEADIRALFNHDPSVVLGRNKAGTLELAEDGTGLHDVIRPPDNEWGRPVLEAVRRGDVSGQSIAFQVVKEKWERPQKRGDLARRTVLEAKLLDVSVVTYPAFEQTSVQARAAYGRGGYGVFDEGEDDRSDVGITGQAFRLARLAEHGYPLDSEDRAMIGAALAILQRVSGEPAPAPGDERSLWHLRDHSPAAMGSEPARRADHSAAARARWLELSKLAVGGIR